MDLTQDSVLLVPLTPIGMQTVTVNAIQDSQGQNVEDH